MAKQTINIGASPNDGTGTPLRTSFDYCNQNFTELYTRTISVRDFGAVGDGVTDNLNAFRNAVAYIDSIGGGTLFVPSGNYAFDIIHFGAYNFAKSIQLCSNISIVMTAGTTLSVLGSWSPGAVYALFLISSGGLYPSPSNIVIDGFGAVLNGINPNQSNDTGVTHGLLFNDKSATGITLRDITVKNWGTCAKLNGTNVIVDSCVFDSGNNVCVAVTDAANVKFSNSRFTSCSAPAGGNCVQAGVDVEANAGETVYVVKFSNCDFSGNGKKGLFFQNGAGLSSRVSVIGCLFENNGEFGCAIAGTTSSYIQDVVVSGNSMRGNGSLAVVNASQLIVGFADKFSITGNNVSGINTNAYGIRVPLSTNGTISGNSVIGCGGSTNTAALQLATCLNVLVSGNTVVTGPELGFIIAGGSNISVSGNSVSQFGKELVILRDDCTSIQFSGNTFAEPCQTANSQYVLSSIAESGFVNWSGNRFVESMKYNAGVVAAYSAGPPTTIQLASLSSQQDGYYNGYYVLVGSTRIQISSYVGSTRTATLASAFGTPPTPGSSTYKIVSARTCSIVINSASAGNGPYYLTGNDWFNSGATVPFYSVTATNIVPTWTTNVPFQIGANYTATLQDEVILVDATAAPRTITLPTIANGRCMNKLFTIKKIDASANAVTIDADGAETIDGALTQSLPAQWNYITVRGNSTGWNIVANF